VAVLRSTSVALPFADRAAAGRALGERLAELLGDFDRRRLLVLGLPRGGVVVAAEVAETLDTPLDAFVVRKLGLPGQPELAMGAIAGGGVLVRNEDVISRARVPDEVVERVAASERVELERREREYRGDRPAVDPAGRLVILVDDGLATGATARAALRALRLASPVGVVLAVPVAPRRTVQELAGDADRLVALAQPQPFAAVGHYYRDFSPTTDDEVRALLRGEPRLAQD
jgi:predicted phosphoribosyltransferase